MDTDTRDDLIRRLHVVTSPRKTHTKASKNKLYASMTVPGLDHLDARRDTVKRAGLLRFPEDMSGEVIVDMGSNCGSISFLCAQRGATVIGYEFNQERVELSNDIAAFAGLNCVFHQMDFDYSLPSLTGVDRVVALAFDVYLSPVRRDALYELLGRVPVVHFESNMEWGVKKCISEITALSGMRVSFLGVGDHYEGIGRTRLLMEQH